MRAACLCLPGPLFLFKLRLATSAELRDNTGMAPDLTALFLLAGALSAVTIAVLREDNLDAIR